MVEYPLLLDHPPPLILDRHPRHSRLDFDGDAVDHLRGAGPRAEPVQTVAPVPLEAVRGNAVRRAVRLTTAAKFGNFFFCDQNFQCKGKKSAFPTSRWPSRRGSTGSRRCPASAPGTTGRRPRNSSRKPPPKTLPTSGSSSFDALRSLRTNTSTLAIGISLGCWLSSSSSTAANSALLGHGLLAIKKLRLPVIGGYKAHTHTLAPATLELVSGKSNFLCRPTATRTQIDRAYAWFLFPLCACLLNVL